MVMYSHACFFSHLEASCITVPYSLAQVNWPFVNHSCMKKWDCPPQQTEESSSSVWCVLSGLCYINTQYIQHQSTDVISLHWNILEVLEHASTYAFLSPLRSKSLVMTPTLTPNQRTKKRKMTYSDCIGLGLQYGLSLMMAWISEGWFLSNGITV